MPYMDSMGKESSLTTHPFSEDMLVFRGVISILEVDGKQLAG